MHICIIDFTPHSTSSPSTNPPSHHHRHHQFSRTRTTREKQQPKQSAARLLAIAEITQGIMLTPTPAIQDQDERGVVSTGRRGRRAARPSPAVLLPWRSLVLLGLLLLWSGSTSHGGHAWTPPRPTPTPTTTRSCTGRRATAWRETPSLQICSRGGGCGRCRLGAGSVRARACRSLTEARADQRAGIVRRKR